jgi:hypothetical protein
LSTAIVVCEPQCLASEHAAVNAALLHTVALAFPESRIRFLGEPTHLKWVQGIVRGKAPATAERVSLNELRIPARSATGWRRYAQELHWSRQITELATRDDTAAVLLTSITSPGLLALKLRLYGARTSTPILAIPHAVLGTLLEPQPVRPWRWLISLRQVLRLPHPRNLAYVALGETIAATVRRATPWLSPHFRTLDLPVLWGSHSVGAPPSQPRPIRFGFLGSGAHPAKGFATFLRLALDVTSQSAGAEFVLVGSVPMSLASPELTRPLSSLSTEPLSDDAYNEVAGGLHFVVGTGMSQHYRLRASATFLDALSQIKPGIYLRTPYVEHYFERLGDIGYLCDTYEEMRDLVLRLAQEFPLERYEAQCANILAGRQVLDPAVLAPQLRRILSYY